MKNTDNIVVIIPTYNRARQVLEGLASVYSQENAQLQAIVINDGSKDGTSELIKENFPQAQIIEGDGNMWWAGAINAGLQQALDTGFDYFLLLNDDNWLAPLSVSHLLDYARKKL